MTLVMSCWLFFGVPDKPGLPRPEPLAAQWAGIRTVFADRYFWHFAPLGFAQIGGFMAVQSLWSSAWLIQVNGFSRALAAEHLAAMNFAMLVAYALIGMLATGLSRRGIGTIYLLGGGMLLALLTLLLIITRASDQHLLLWMAYGLFSSTGTLVYAQVSTGFPVALSGRASTSLNLVVFAGAFSLQWGMGILIDTLREHGFSAETAHVNAFAVLFVVQAAACLWLFVGGKVGGVKALAPP